MEIVHARTHAHACTNVHTQHCGDSIVVVVRVSFVSFFLIENFFSLHTMLTTVFTHNKHFN